MDRTLLIVGVNHRTAPLVVRERLAYADDQVGAALSRLKAAAPAIGEAALLSTCNRVEIVAACADAQDAADSALAFLAADRGVERVAFENAIYRHEGRAAIRHLLRVGASLDSMVVGEPQILGQLKSAYAEAAAAGTAGLVLHRAFHKAFAVAKRVRRSTLIGHGAVSVSSAAVSLARRIFDTLADKTVMLMGAGKMAELTARQLVRLGVESLTITNRTFDRAVALARELGGTAVPFENFKPYLKYADVVIGSMAATKPVLTREDAEPIMRERRYRPMFLIDLGVPRNFDERLNALANLYLYDVDDLGELTAQSQGEREREAHKAEAIVGGEVESFWRWLNGRELVPAIKEIRDGIERLRERELIRHRGWLSSLEPDKRDRIDALTRGLANKILHQVLTGLRDGNGAGDQQYAIEVARRLLAGAPLDESDDEGGGDDDF